MMFFKEIAVVVLAVVSMVTATTEHHSFTTRYGHGIVAREDIEMNRQQQYMEVTITPVRGNLIATTNLHDFSEGYTAIKDEERDTCYILDTEHTLEEMLDTFQQSVERKGYFDIQQRFKCVNKKFIDNADLYLYGERIADFCKNHEVVFAEKKFIQREKRSVNMLAGRSMICGICSGYC